MRGKIVKPTQHYLRFGYQNQLQYRHCLPRKNYLQKMLLDYQMNFQ